MNVKTSITVEGNELVIFNDATTTRIAAGELTNQLVPILARPLLFPDELAVLELLGLPYVGLIVRERDGPEQERPEQAVQELLPVEED